MNGMSDTRALGFATLPKSEAARVVGEHPELVSKGSSEAAPFVIAIATDSAAEAGLVADLLVAVSTVVTEQGMAAAAILRALLPAGRLTALTPAVLEQVHGNAEARAELADEFGLFSSVEVARRAGSKATNAPALASRWKSQGRLFTVDVDQAPRFPGFQFDDRGRPLTVIADVVDVFAGKLPDWELALWFTSPNTWLSDLRPVDVLRQEPKLVAEAAQHLAEELLG
jgi:hypothetical protein